MKLHCFLLATFLNQWWLQLNGNPQPLSSDPNTQPFSQTDLKWLSWVVSTYLYDAFDSMFLSCHIRISEWIHTLQLPEYQRTSYLKQVRNLKFKWLELDSIVIILETAGSIQKISKRAHFCYKKGKNGTPNFTFYLHSLCIIVLTKQSFEINKSSRGASRYQTCKQTLNHFAKLVSLAK